MTVQVRQAELRTVPSFLGNSAGTLPYGMPVVILEQAGAWYRVASSRGSGWLHASALTKKTVVLEAGSTVDTTASSREVALAGKGFNSEVEARFKATHLQIDFAWVDRMEGFKVPVSRLETFAREGRLSVR